MKFLGENAANYICGGDNPTLPANIQWKRETCVAEVWACSAVSQQEVCNVGFLNSGISNSSYPLDGTGK